MFDLKKVVRTFGLNEDDRTDPFGDIEPSDSLRPWLRDDAGQPLIDHSECYFHGVDKILGILVSGALGQAVPATKGGNRD